MTFRTISIFLALTASLLLPLPTQARHSTDDTVAFVARTDSFFTALLQEVPEVPGLALAVVVDDRVVLTRGYGMADLEHHIPSTDQTIYYIASATKPFTALAAALLDARGTIDLDSPLAEHLKGSGMNLELVAPDVTLRDLLSHTSGLKNGPVTTRLAYTGEHTPQLLWKLLSATESSEAGPHAFEYTNFDYNLLTLIFDRELGIQWQDLLRDEIFQPLDMERTTAYASQPNTMGWPMAAPYFGLHPDGIQRVGLEKTDATMQSAGGIMTTAEDAARWMLVQINEGELDGQRVIDADLIRETHHSRVTPSNTQHDLFGLSGCGLGWLKGNCAGQTVLYHTGGYPGFRSLISFMEQPRIGVAIFVNEGSIGGRMLEPLAAWVYDWWLDRGAADPREEIAHFVAMRDQFAKAITTDFEHRAQRAWNLELEPPAYAGSYESADFGTLRIAREDSTFTVDLGLLHSTAEPYTKPNTMRVELLPGHGEVLRFEVRNDAVVSVSYDGTRFVRQD